MIEDTISPMRKSVTVHYYTLPGRIIRPHTIAFDDGRSWHITEVLKVVPRYQYDWHETVTYYQIMIGDHRTELFHGKDGWFVELKR